MQEEGGTWSRAALSEAQTSNVFMVAREPVTRKEEELRVRRKQETARSGKAKGGRTLRRRNTVKSWSGQAWQVLTGDDVLGNRQGMLGTSL